MLRTVRRQGRTCYDQDHFGLKLQVGTFMSGTATSSGGSTLQLSVEECHAVGRARRQSSSGDKMWSREDRRLHRHMAQSAKSPICWPCSLQDEHAGGRKVGLLRRHNSLQYGEDGKCLGRLGCMSIIALHGINQVVKDWSGRTIVSRCAHY